VEHDGSYPSLAAESVRSYSEAEANQQTTRAMRGPFLLRAICEPITSSLTECHRCHSPVHSPTMSCDEFGGTASISACPIRTLPRQQAHDNLKGHTSLDIPLGKDRSSLSLRNSLRQGRAIQAMTARVCCRPGPCRGGAATVDVLHPSSRSSMPSRGTALLGSLHGRAWETEAFRRLRSSNDLLAAACQEASTRG